MELERKPLPILPLEIVKFFEGFKVNECTQYKTNLKGPNEYYALPWTIAPVFVKACTQNTPLDTDLTNPQPGDAVLPNAQLWVQRNNEYFTLSENIKRTIDKYNPSKSLSFQTCIYDGINKNNKALCACQYYAHRPDAFYELYVFTQSDEFGLETKHVNVQPFFRDYGTLCSLMLEPERNRFIYSVCISSSSSSYKLVMQDLIQSNKNLSDENHPNEKILTTKKLFIKTVYLGKDTYFGITYTGQLYSIWVDKTANLTSAEQKFISTPHTFTDISVDNTVRTEKGFKPKCAFLTSKGEIFTTHLDAYARPTLLYVTTVENPTDAKRLFYKNGQLSILYKNNNKVLVWEDNFDLLYFCSLLKKLYKNVCA